MHLAFYNSLLSEPSQFHQRNPKDKPPKGDNSETILPIIIGLIFISVFIPLFFFMYRSWRWEKANILKTRPAVSTEDGNRNFEKAELSSGSSVIIHEMDSVQEAQELPDTKDGLSHELPGAMALPQELPAALHEMPADSWDEKMAEKRRITKSAATLQNLAGKR